MKLLFMVFTFCGITGVTLGQTTTPVLGENEKGVHGVYYRKKTGEQTFQPGDFHYTRGMHTIQPANKPLLDTVARKPAALSPVKH
jgi:hypothetical protein